MLKKNGFTLIELLIVLAIIGIIAAVAVPTFMRHVRKSQETHQQEATKRFHKVKDTAVRTAKTFGFTDVRNLASPNAPDLRVYGCGEYEQVLEADATNAKNEKVQLIFCCHSEGHSCTIRGR